jgi:hypothetical protein
MIESVHAWIIIYYENWEDVDKQSIQESTDLYIKN